MSPFETVTKPWPDTFDPSTGTRRVRTSSSLRIAAGLQTTPREQVDRRVEDTQLVHLLDEAAADKVHRALTEGTDALDALPRLHLAELGPLRLACAHRFGASIEGAAERLLDLWASLIASPRSIER